MVGDVLIRLLLLIPVFIFGCVAGAWIGLVYQGFRYSAEQRRGLMD